jgi:hypothetical protein
MARAPTGELKLLLGLLREYSTISQVQRFLAERKLPRTSSGWEELVSERILPALDSGKITQADILSLFKESEEYGTQHIFLYRVTEEATAKSEQLMAANRVRALLRARGNESIADKPRMIDKPAAPTPVDARWNDDDFVIKVVEKRIYERKTSQHQVGNRIIIEVDPIELRAVNLFRLQRNGLLELRVQSYTNVTQYDEAVRKMWDMLSYIFTPTSFEEIPLARVKTTLWRKRDELQQEIRYSDSIVRNDSGTTLRIATGDMDANLSDDNDAAKSLDSFMSSRAYCDRTNVWFVHRDGALPSRDIHTIIGGRVNEFAIPAACSKEDYEHVLGRLLHYNK